MPLEQRVIEPICISRGTLPLDAQGSLAISIPNELECVTNGTLANVIRQLSTLSKDAEDVFGGIIRDTTKLINRTSDLQGRIDRLAISVTQLDSTAEDVSIHDIHNKKPFKSSTSCDQQVASRQTLPSSLLGQYKLCDTPPPLSKLNAYREDGKDGLKFYTDPTYFFELWRQEMLQMSERDAKLSKKGGHRVKTPPTGAPNGVIPSATANRTKKPRPAANTRERFQAQVAQQEFLPAGVNKYNNNNTTPGPYDGQQQHYYNGSGSNPPNGGGIYNTAGAYGTLQRPSSLEINQFNENPYGVHQYHQMQQRMSQQHMDYTGYPPGNNGAHHPDHIQQQQANYVNKMNHHPQDYPQQSQHSPGQGYTPPQQSTPTHRRGSTPNHRPSQPPPAPPSNTSSNSSSGQVTPNAGTPSRNASRGASVNRDILPPPPPPPPPIPTYESQRSQSGVINGQELPFPPPISSAQPSSLDVRVNGPTSNHIIPHSADANGLRNTSSATPTVAPPPPPPLPVDGIIPPLGGRDQPDGLTRSHHGGTEQGSAPPSFAQMIQAKHSQLQPPKVNPNNRLLPQHASNDARSGLLAAIREGIKLRRVEDSRAKEVEKSAPCNDVASILARRVPQELSDSDSDGDHSGFESDAWEDS